MDRPTGLRRRTDDGATAVEYGLLITAIAAVIVVIVFALGGVVADLFGGTCDKVNDQVAASSRAHT